MVEQSPEQVGYPPLESVYGTLPDWAIKAYIRRGDIVIDPLPADWEKRTKGVTIDFSLGRILKIPRHQPYNSIDTRRPVDESEYKTIELEVGQLYVVTPDQFLLAVTLERLVLPNDIMGELDGRSRFARYGLEIHQSAARFDPGWDGYPVLELKNNTPSNILVYCGDPVCAFRFQKLMAPVERAYAASGGKYGSETDITGKVDGGFISTVQ